MRKVLLILSLVFMLVNAFCQSSKITLGVDVGVGFTKMRGDSFRRENFNEKIGGLVGVSIDYKLTPNFGLSTGLYYEGKGDKVELQFVDNLSNFTDFNVKYCYDYLTLPLKITYMVGKKIKLKVEGGLFVGYLLNTRLKSSMNVGDINTFTDHPISNYKKLDGGLTASAGILVPITKCVSISASIYENCGLLNIAKEQNDFNYTVKTNAYGVKIGLSYRL